MLRESRLRASRIAQTLRLFGHLAQFPLARASSAQVGQFIKQRFGVPQVGGVSAFAKPVIGVDEHSARLVAAALFREQFH